MDILRPPMVYIGHRKYRKNNVQDHVLPAFENRGDFSSGQDCYEYGDESCNAGCEADAEIERTSRGYSLSFHVPHVFHKFIIGKKGETKKRLETETKTQIKVPRQIEDGDIVITGADKAGVSSAKTRIDVLIASARRCVPFTHFLSFPVTDILIRSKLEDFKTQVLQCCGKDRGIDSSIFQNGYKLHMTVGTMVLLDEREVQQAIDELEVCKNELFESVLHNEPLNIRVCGLEYMNDDPNSVDVLYAKVSLTDESNRHDIWSKTVSYSAIDKLAFSSHRQTPLQLFADRIVDRFVNAGIMKREYERVKLHITVMNSLMRKDQPEMSSTQPDQLKVRESFNAVNILKLFQDYHFGDYRLDSIHISQRSSASPNSYYTSSAFVNLP